MHGGAHSSSAFALPRAKKPPSVDLSKLTSEDLQRLNPMEKDAALLRLSTTVRNMEEHRGNRIDRAEFAAWEEKIEKEKDRAMAADARAMSAEATAEVLQSTNNDQRAEIARLKRALAQLQEESGDAAAAVAAAAAADGDGADDDTDDDDDDGSDNVNSNSSNNNNSTKQQ